MQCVRCLSGKLNYSGGYKLYQETPRIQNSWSGSAVLFQHFKKCYFIFTDTVVDNTFSARAINSNITKKEAICARGGNFILPDVKEWLARGVYKHKIGTDQKK